MLSTLLNPDDHRSRCRETDGGNNRKGNQAPYVDKGTTEYGADSAPNGHQALCVAGPLTR